MNIDKDIEILKEMLKDKEQLIRYHAWIGTNALEAIENVLSELEIYKKMFEEIVEGYMNEFTGCNDVKEFTEYLRKKVQK